MASVAETFKAEVLIRLRAAPLYVPNVNVDRIRRSHLTAVPRTEAPTLYARFGRAKPTADKACKWQWEMEWTVSVYVRSDDDAEADPLVVQVVNRLNPLVGTPYSNNVTLNFSSVDAETEIADDDAQRVDVRGVAKFVTNQWSLEA